MMPLTNKRLLPIRAFLAIVLVATSACASAPRKPERGGPDWPAYGGDAMGSRYSSLAQIDRSNVTRLAVAWTYHTGEPLPTANRRRSLETTPIVINGVMYLSTPLGKVIALDPVTGKEKWKFDARVDPAVRFGDFTNRGVSAWRDRIFLATTDTRLIALNALTGIPVPSFGHSGTVNKGLRNDGMFTPPSFEGSLVLPSNIGGAHWGGLTFDPVRQIPVVPVNRLAAMVQLIPVSSANLDSLRASRSRIGFEDTRMRGTPYIMRRKILFVPPGVACTPDPPAALVAIDLKSGTKAWEQPLLPNLGGPIATAGGLIFLAATIDPFIRAFDIENGRELWRAELPGAGKATPMTYRGADGRQYVVIAAGGDGETWKPADAIVAFALKR